MGKFSSALKGLSTQAKQVFSQTGTGSDFSLPPKGNYTGRIKELTLTTYDEKKAGFEAEGLPMFIVDFEIMTAVENKTLEGSTFKKAYRCGPTPSEKTEGRSLDGEQFKRLIKRVTGLDTDNEDIPLAEDALVALEQQLVNGHAVKFTVSERQVGDRTYTDFNVGMPVRNG